MKLKKAKKLLRKLATANDFEVDLITGQTREVTLYGEDWNGYDVLISFNKNKSGKVTSLTYMNFGSDPSSIYDNLYANVELSNPKKFVKQIGSTLSGTVVLPENIDVFASFVDSLSGVSPGSYSTFISMYGGTVTTFA